MQRKEYLAILLLVIWKESQHVYFAAVGLRSTVFLATFWVELKRACRMSFSAYTKTIYCNVLSKFFSKVDTMSNERITE